MPKERSALVRSSVSSRRVEYVAVSVLCLVIVAFALLWISQSTTEPRELVVMIAMGADMALDNRETYVVGETLYVKIIVKDSRTGKGVPNVNFHCPLYNSQSNAILDYWGTTDANGEWTLKIQLANEDYLGTWSLGVNDVLAEGYESWSMAGDPSRHFTVVSERPPEENGSI